MIIIDGSDPVGPAEGLFHKDFFEFCYKGLAENGVLTAQTESPFVPAYHKSIRQVAKAMAETFDVFKMYLAFIPLYPTGMWSMMYASKSIVPHSEEAKARVSKGMQEFGQSMKYYNEDMHSGAFALPNFVKEIIR